MLDPERPVSRRILFSTYNYEQAVRVMLLCQSDQRKLRTSYITIEKPNHKWARWRVVRYRNLTDRQIVKFKARGEAWRNRALNQAVPQYIQDRGPTAIAEYNARRRQWYGIDNDQQDLNERRIQERLRQGYGPGYGERGLGDGDYNATITRPNLEAQERIAAEQARLVIGAT